MYDKPKLRPKDSMLVEEFRSNLPSILEGQDPALGQHRYVHDKNVLLPWPTPVAIAVLQAVAAKPGEKAPKVANRAGLAYHTTLHALQKLEKSSHVHAAGNIQVKWYLTEKGHTALKEASK